MDVLVPVMGLAFLGSIAGLLGGVLLLINKRMGKFLSIHAVAFAAGVLLAVSLLDLIPEALEVSETGTVMTMILGVFVVASLLERFIVHFHHHDSHNHEALESAVPLVLFGDAMHNFLDGVAIAAAFLVDPRLGFFTALATFLHELPQEIGDFGILLSAGWSRMKIIAFNLFTALSTFMGALVVLFFADRVEGITGLLLSIACGLFLYIATTDLLPRISAHSTDKRFFWHQYVLFLAGILLMIVVGALIPE